MFIQEFKPFHWRIIRSAIVNKADLCVVLGTGYDQFLTVEGLGKVVESSSLALVLPQAITRPHHLPQDLIDEGTVKVQLDAVAYASQMHEVLVSNNRKKMGLELGRVGKFQVNIC